MKSILAVSTRPESLHGYSLGLTAPKKDGEDAWFGHGGARGTNCSVNWHKKELVLWAVQLDGNKPRPWDAARNEANTRFFRHVIDNGLVEEYTGRVK